MSRDGGIDATIAQADCFNTKIVGTSFENRQDSVPWLTSGDPVDLVRQPENQYDRNAIAVFFGPLQVGYLSKEIAQYISPMIDAGTVYQASVTNITGGELTSHGKKSWGINIFVQKVW